MSVNEGASVGSPRKQQYSTFGGEGRENGAVSSDSATNTARTHGQSGSSPSNSQSSSWSIVRFFSSIFGYRKTTLTLLTAVTLVATYVLFLLDSSLDFTVSLPTSKHETAVLESAWSDLQEIGRFEHPYASRGNDFVHDFLESKISKLVSLAPSYFEFDNDLNYTNNIMYGASGTVHYYESNNIVVRINGTNPKLPALLVSAHFDSVPSSFGVTDDGMGIASMLGLLDHYSSSKQPTRTIVFNFNNNEEFGLYGATSFLSHPWSKNVAYFLNLEGTGAGGKCVLFRGTDYGVTKYFKLVRYPFGTSLFQQGFNNRLIHSETDYKIYKEDGGLRGIDLAFYKPRDFYHTAGDSIKNIDINALWHMLSNSLDYVKIMSEPLDLDDDVPVDEDVKKLLGSITEGDTSYEFASFGSFLNYFFALPVSKLVIFNIVILVIVPFVSIPLLAIIYYKKSWSVTFINFIKVPVAFQLSLSAADLISKFLFGINPFLANSNYFLLVSTLFSILLLLNYLILNLINLIFYNYKVVNHDEKLITILQSSFVYWILLIISSVGLSFNRIGKDHTGEYPLTVLLIIQSVAGFIGLLSWSFKKSKRNYDIKFVREEEQQPLIGSSSENYGTEQDGADRPGSTSSSFSLSSSLVNASEEDLKEKKSLNYGWSLQFLLIVPLSSFLIYNAGTLILDGLNKSIQESLHSEELINKFIQLFAVAWVVPFLPFVFKFNKFFVLILAVFAVQGVFRIGTTDAFDELNPLKLRFIQSIDLDKELDLVNVYGRIGSPMENVLKDIPSLKESGELLVCSSIGDGMEVCSYNTTQVPTLVPDVKHLKDYINVEVLKNSLNDNIPFGLLTGEIKINVPKNRLCTLNFHLTDSKVESSILKSSPVKTVIVYEDKKSNVTQVERGVDLSGIPKGFSKDTNGNYIFKDLDGIETLQLNKLDWNKPYHIGFQWVPNFIEMDVEASAKINKLGVEIQCFWGDLGSSTDKNGQVHDTIPVYKELMHYSPNYVSWANREKGLVSVSRSVEI